MTFLYLVHRIGSAEDYGKHFRAATVYQGFFTFEFKRLPSWMATAIN